VERRAEEDRPALYYAESDEQRSTSFWNRWEDIRLLGDFRSTDSVLDVGCAEGRITLEVAALVSHATGFDVSPERVAEAVRLAAERRIENVAFEVGSIDDYPLAPGSYDVTLFLAVWGKPLGGDRTVGAEHLRRILRATSRQLLIRVGVQKEPHKERRLGEILALCDAEGFDALCFSRSRDDSEAFTRGNLIVAHRRGTDARAGTLPPLTLVPTERLVDHPIVRSAASIEGGQELLDESPPRALPKRQARARERIDELRRVADIRPGDHVLLVSSPSSAASDVASIEQDVVVETTALGGDDVPPDSSYDLVLVLDAWGKPLAGTGRVGILSLVRWLRATRRQLIVRAGFQNDPLRELELDQIFAACEAEGFDVLGFSRGRRDGERSIRDNLVVASRRGAGARTGELRRLAVIPTAHLDDHPIVRTAASIRDRPE
jgi:SAM-dependent methyltransferase